MKKTHRKWRRGPPCGCPLAGTPGPRAQRIASKNHEGRHEYKEERGGPEWLGASEGRRRWPNKQRRLGRRVRDRRVCRKTGYRRRSECRRARDAKRDIPVPLSPCARATTCTCRGRPAPGPRLRHFAPPPDPYDEWLDGVSDALASGLRQLRDLRPLRHFGQPLAPTPTADYPPRASRFPGGQRQKRWWHEMGRPKESS